MPQCIVVFDYIFLPFFLAKVPLLEHLFIFLVLTRHIVTSCISKLFRWLAVFAFCPFSKLKQTKKILFEACKTPMKQV